MTNLQIYFRVWKYFQKSKRLILKVNNIIRHWHVILKCSKWTETLTRNEIDSCDVVQSLQKCWRIDVFFDVFWSWRVQNQESTPNRQSQFKFHKRKSMFGTEMNRTIIRNDFKTFWNNIEISKRQKFQTAQK